MEERARRIIEEAIALAEEGGFEAVRLRDLASRSGVALGTVYSRFPSKEAILVAALDSEVAKFEDVLREFPIDGETPLDRVAFFFEAASLGLIAREGFARAVLRAVGSGDPGVAEHIIGYQDRITSLVVRALRGGSDGSPGDHEVCFLLQQVWYAELIGWLCGARNTDEVVAHTQQAARLLLAGLHHIQSTDATDSA